MPASFDFKHDSKRKYNQLKFTRKRKRLQEDISTLPNNKTILEHPIIYQNRSRYNQGGGQNEEPIVTENHMDKWL